MHRERFYTLTASCPDRVGIVAAVSGFFAKHGGWILETTLHSEPPNDDGIAAYFMRLEIKADSLPFDLEGLRAAFQPVAAAPAPEKPRDAKAEATALSLDEERAREIDARMGIKPDTSTSAAK